MNGFTSEQEARIRDIVDDRIAAAAVDMIRNADRSGASGLANPIDDERARQLSALRAVALGVSPDA